MLEFILSLVTFTSLTPSNYDQISDGLQRLAQQFAATSQLIEVGKNDSGVMIYGLRIGNGPIRDLIVATHHGNEYGSTAVAMGAAESLAGNPIAGHTTFVIPVINVSGYNRRDRYEDSRDPNRDYPGPCATSGPFKLKSTKALADFVAVQNITASATLHTYSPAVLYPWGMSTQDLKTEYESTFVGLTKDATVESGYQIGNSAEVLYAADGTFEDYAFWKHGIWSLLFEMGSSHSPDSDSIKRMVEDNVPGLRRFLTNAPPLRADHHDFKGHCDIRVQRRIWLE